MFVYMAREFKGLAQFFIELASVPKKTINLKAQLHQLIVSKIFFPKNMQPQPKKYCWALTLRYSKNNTKCYSKEYTGT